MDVYMLLTFPIFQAFQMDLGLALAYILLKRLIRK